MTMLAGDGCRGAAFETAGTVPGADGFGGGGGAIVTFPSLKPASCKLRLAAPNACPMKLGITYAGGSGAAEMSRLVLGAATWLAFAGGDCASTWSGVVPANCISAVDV